MSSNHHHSHSNYYEEISAFLRGKAPLFEKELTLLRKLEDRDKHRKGFMDGGLTRVTSQTSNLTAGLNSNNVSSSNAGNDLSRRLKAQQVELGLEINEEENEDLPP